MIEGLRSGFTAPDDPPTKLLTASVSVSNTYSHILSRAEYQYQIDEQHFINVRNIDGDIDKSVKDEGGSNEVMTATTPKDIVTKEHVIHVKLYYNSKAEQQKKIEQATSLKVEVNIKPFYGVTDLFPHYVYKNTDIRKQRLIDWALGYEAVRLAQVHEETARRLKGKVDTLAAIEAEQETEQVGGREKYEIHHVTGVGQDGAVYDVDNMRITTPKLHINIHSNKGA